MTQTDTSPSPARRADAGFTLVELLVSLAVTAVLILGVLATFDFSARMNRVQMNVADMQQSLRIGQNEIVKLARMAGRGRLPAAMAVDIRNNVAAGTRLVPLQDSTLVLEGTDVLTLRGVFSSTLYQIEYLNPDVWTAPNAEGEGSVGVLPTTAGVPQDLDALEKLAEDGEPLVLVTPFGVVAVAEVTRTSRLTLEDGRDYLRVEFERRTPDLGAPVNPSLPAAAQIGILEEHVFYVRRTGGGGSSPSLARARMEPGTTTPYKNDIDYATLDIADNIADLQVTRGGGVTPELRLTTLARTDRADPGKYTAPLLPALIEDHAYPANHPFNMTDQRRHRWRLMRTNLDLRNL